MECTREQQAENRRKWVEALRSGKYTQCRYKLTNECGDHCALGVAKEVLGLRPDSNSEYTGIQIALGLRTITMDGIHHTKTITYANDVIGKSFAEIADIAESPDCDWFTK